MRFLDTNVLMYAVSPAPEEAAKRRRAQQLLYEGDLALSVQVLQEFYYQATRPTRVEQLTSAQALRFLSSIEGVAVLPITPELFHDAVAICERFKLSYWDSAILAAARACGCDAVYSEDFSSEQDYDGLRVVDPFRGAPE